MHTNSVKQTYRSASNWRLRNEYEWYIHKMNECCGITFSRHRRTVSASQQFYLFKEPVAFNCQSIFMVIPDLIWHLKGYISDVLRRFVIFFILEVSREMDSDSFKISVSLIRSSAVLLGRSRRKLVTQRYAMILDWDTILMMIFLTKL